MKMNDWKLNERLKIERTLNFSTIPQEEDELCYSRRKITRDPMSHRIIEKRRRDRMNNCLADLSRLIPHQYMKKSRGRIEKTEIIEMAIKHLKHLQAHSCKDLANCEVAKASEQEWQHQYRLGFQECTSEAVRFLVESEGLFPAEGICFRLLAHLQEHYDKLSCYPNGRVGPQLGEDSNNAPMDLDSASIHNGGMTDSFPINSLKRATSPPPFESQEILPVAASQHHLLQNADHQPDDRCQALTPVAASQLREMLQNPNVPVERVRSNSTSSTASSYSSRPYVNIYESYPKGQPCEEVYKFKNNIKERFNADLHQQVDETPTKYSISNASSNSATVACFTSPVTAKCRGGASTGSSSAMMEIHHSNGNNNEQSIKTLNDGDLASVNSQNDPQTDSSNGSSSPVSNGRSNGSSSGYSTAGDTPSKVKLQQSRSQSPDPGIFPPRRINYSANGGRPNSPYQKTTMVPIFALHSKGNFYIPLSLESNLLAPYLHSVDYSVPVLHPVSISVNFCGSLSFSGPEPVTWHQQHNGQAQVQQNGSYDRFREENY